VPGLLRTLPFLAAISGLGKSKRRAPAAPGRAERRGVWGAISGSPILIVLAIATSIIAGEIPQAERRSGYDFMSGETRAMQDDDTANPGMLWVLEGASLWQRKTGAAARACADCHGDAGASMKGVAARHPAFDAARGRPINLEQRINACRVERQQAPPLAWESRELLALTAYVARQSRGLPIDVAGDPRTQPFVEAGRATFHRRQGQLDLACTQCHDEQWGRRLAGNVIPQAHPTGYPLYRLEWQSLGSLERRLRNCLVGIRAEPYEYGAPELVDLELYLMWRARGMTLEAPAVRP
jgi:L-cysteine S-thiosulfotransferase